MTTASTIPRVQKVSTFWHTSWRIVDVEIEVGAKERFEHPSKPVAPVIGPAFEEGDKVGDDDLLLGFLLRLREVFHPVRFENVDWSHPLGGWIDVHDIVEAIVPEASARSPSSR